MPTEITSLPPPQRSHDRSAAANVRAVADHHARRNPALDHRRAQCPGVVVDEAFVHDRGARSQVGAQSHSVRVGDPDAVRYDVVDHAWELVDAIDIDRPEAPQLPLYAVLSDAAPLEAVAFGQIRAGKEMGLQGFATSADIGIRIPRQHPEDLEEQVKEWRRVLTSLAEDFYNGDARVRPKNFPSTCTYCAQRLLCRIDAASFEQQGEEATEAEHD